jgi:hypothetical protein
MEGRKNINNEMENREIWYKIKYKTSKTPFFFQKPKFQYTPTSEVGSVWEEHISH